MSWLVWPHTRAMINAGFNPCMIDGFVDFVADSLFLSFIGILLWSSIKDGICAEVARTYLFIVCVLELFLRLASPAIACLPQWVIIICVPIAAFLVCNQLTVGIIGMQFMDDLRIDRFNGDFVSGCAFGASCSLYAFCIRSGLLEIRIMGPVVIETMNMFTKLAS